MLTAFLTLTFLGSISVFTPVFPPTRSDLLAQSPSIAPSSAVLPRITAQVISVGDGDTLRVQVGSDRITVRLACVDAPESSQPQGQQSANRLHQLLPNGAGIALRTVDIDRYGRTVAEVYRNEHSVNLQMVQEGRAVVYQQYLGGCAATRDRYLQAESRARQQRLAFWSQSNPVMPWDWRNGARPTTPPRSSTSSSPSPRPSGSLSRPPAEGRPANGDYDCSDFRTQAQAQQVLNASPGAPYGLDRDHDGIACEGLS